VSLLSVGARRCAAPTWLEICELSCFQNVISAPKSNDHMNPLMRYDHLPSQALMSSIEYKLLGRYRKWGLIYLSAAYKRIGQVLYQHDK
jgi:hypothetical protein